METPTRRPGEETARLGKEIYEREIRSLVEADHHGGKGGAACRARLTPGDLLLVARPPF